MTDGGDVEREVERQSLLAIAHLLKTAAFGGAEIETVGLPFPRQPRHALAGRRAPTCRSRIADSMVSASGSAAATLFLSQPATAPA